MTTVTTISPCKLNLFLYITSKRDDGYHNLQTLFVILNHGDKMTFIDTNDDEILLSTDFGFPVEKNLIYKAAKALKRETGCQKGCKISIDKILPQGGGLGGGSSNAATTLLILNKLWELNLPENTLINIGAKLGADVPVFIKGCTCFAEGIGEILTEKKIKNRYYLVATPECSVPTAKLFAHEKLKKDSKVRTFDELINTPFANCFEKVVVHEYPEVQNLLSILSQYGRAFMSGSGSSCFVGFDNLEDAKKAQKHITKLNIKNFLTESTDRSPVLKTLDTIIENQR